MANIKVLDSTVYNRIAAGEVVERPASVIKELVENAIDAQADSISIEIAQGGRELIRVTDNGCGIACEDLKTAFLPHATSKIHEIDDLDGIATLGFRGEALASIAAVAKVTLKSKTADAETGWELHINGGVFDGEPMVCAANVGTQFTVEHLFYNAPVRAKFLKSDRSEEGEISDLISRFILSHPEIQFCYTVNGKEIYRTFGRDLYSAIHTVYGEQTVRNLMPLQDDDGYGLRLDGYIGKPEFCKPNRTYQTLLVNGRYVANTAISGTVQNAYSEFMVKRQYPFFVLNLTMPLDQVDVNVHPNKKEVRFQDAKYICGVFYRAVQRVLSGSVNAQNVFHPEKAFIAESKPEIERTQKVWGRCEERNQAIKPSLGRREEFSLKFRYSDESASNEEDAKAETVEKQDEANPVRQILERVKNQGVTYPDARNQSVADSGSDSYLDKVLDAHRDIASILGCSNSDKDDSSKQDIEISDKPVEKTVEISAETPLEIQVNTQEFVADRCSAEDRQEDRKVSSKQEIVQQTLTEQCENRPAFRFCGQFFSTYLIVELGDDVLVIDQHAAHERLLYDRLLAEFERSDIAVQPLMMPYMININRREYAMLEEYMDDLEAIGFEIAGLNDCIKISAIPLCLTDIDLDRYFAEILSDNGRSKNILDRHQAKESLMQKACKAAVKGGDRLTENEVEKLLDALDSDMELRCPHGRPILLRYTRREIEKRFSRIV